MKAIATILLVATSIPAWADRMPMPADTPASYRSECGSCHLAYPPALLVAGDWQKLMAGLDKHFGSDATVDGKNRAEIESFLKRHAGDPGRVGSGGNPPRISQTARFVRKHDEVPARYWSDKRVRSVANCEACHPRAADGRFSEHDISIPELRR